jgi:hypothetical protein
MMYLETAKQNQKFPFHFLSAPPTPPAEENKKGKENFWFLLPRPKGADEARIIQHQDCFGKKFGFCSGDTAISAAPIILPDLESNRGRGRETGVSRVGKY